METEEDAMAVGDANARLLLAVTTIAFGYFLRRIGLADVDVGKSLLKVLFNATLPSVLLLSIFSVTFDAQSAAVSACALGQAIVLFIAHLAFRGQGRPPKELALLAGSCVGVNLGTFCYPLVESVWGSEGLTRVVLFDAVNQWSLLIVVPLLYASCIAGASFSPVKALANVRKQLMSPCLLAMFSAIAFRLAGLSLPEPVTAFASSLALANKPLALLALGILFDPQLNKTQFKDIGTLLALRYGTSLLLGAAMMATLGASMGPECTAVVVAALISPVPLLTVTYAVEYDCDVKLGASAVNAGNFCSFGLLLAVANTNFTNAASLAPAMAAAGTALALIGVMGARGKRASRDRVTPAQASSSRSSRARGAHIHGRRQVGACRVHDVGLVGSLGAVNVHVQIAKGLSARPKRVPFAAKVRSRGCVTSNRVQTVASSVATGRFVYV